jgi:hypothetical protein
LQQATKHHRRIHTAQEPDEGILGARGVVYRVSEPAQWLQIAANLRLIAIYFTSLTIFALPLFCFAAASIVLKFIDC